MIRALPLLLAGLLLTLPGRAEKASRRAIQEFLRAARHQYESAEDQDTETFAEAATAFRAAADQGEPGDFDLDAVRLAEAMAWLRADNPQAALEAFERIRGFDHPADRARHHFHRGNAHLQAGKEARNQQALDAALEHMKDAVESFTTSLMDAPDFDPASHNLELAQRELQEIEEEMPPPPPPDETEPDDEDPEEDPDDPPPPHPDDEEEDPEPDPDTDPLPSDEDEEPTDAPPEVEDPAPEHLEDVEGEPPPDDPEFEEIDEENAQRILDSLLEQERRQREEILRDRHRRRVPVEKDW